MTTTTVSSSPRRLLIEGWRFVPHSYAFVAHAHCLCIARRVGIDLRFVDLPLYSETWKRARGVFAPAEEQLLEELRSPEASFLPEATFTLRPEQPDFSAPRSGRRFAFGTAEYRVLTEANASGLRSAADVPETVDVITPSRWAGLAFERFGFSRERVHVVPHGIDPLVLHPDEASRRASREALGVSDAFVFMSVGAMTWNKGLDLLLAAFARVAETEPDVHLVLKGMDALYGSQDFVRELMDDLPARARETVASRLTYGGGTLPARSLARLLRAADCYVSPYRAEGFNLPVLEAMACGVPVACTAGGPTDEFTDRSFAEPIRSQVRKKRLDATTEGDALEPDLEHLVTLMRDAARQRDRLPAMGALAAQHAAKNFTWDAVTDLLLARLLP
jgi:glycosyltransferase involved in cell wall biosynthesis